MVSFSFHLELVLITLNAIEVNFKCNSFPLTFKIWSLIQLWTQKQAALDNSHFSSQRAFLSFIFWNLLQQYNIAPCKIWYVHKACIKLVVLDLFIYREAMVMYR